MVHPANDRALMVKVCGLRTQEDVAVAVRAGADAVGFILSDTSVRALDPQAIAALIRGVPEGTLSVLVAHDRPAAEAARIAREVGADVLQLHGATYEQTDFAAAIQEIPRVWRAVSLAEQPSLTVGVYGEERLILDSPAAGSGHRWDLSALAGKQPQGPWLLAGGLTPENVGDAIAQAQPWGVDVSSGVEGERGVKDHSKITEFVARARAAESAGRSA